MTEEYVEKSGKCKKQRWNDRNKGPLTPDFYSNRDTLRNSKRVVLREDNK